MIGILTRSTGTAKVIGVVECAIYLAIVGGITRFRPGISRRAQRGRFVSWGVLGTITGSVFDYLTEKDGDDVLDDLEAKWGQQHRLLCLCKIALGGAFWTATVGGIVAMIQQYIHLFRCVKSFLISTYP